MSFFQSAPCTAVSCGEDGDVRYFDLREDADRPQAGMRLPVKGRTRGWSEVRLRVCEV